MTAKQIAIDGPAGAGKSTAAKLVAAKLGYLYIDTGAMYRAIALLAIRNNIKTDDDAQLEQLARQADLQLLPDENGCRVMLAGEDVSQQIRQPEVGNAASPVSAVAGVREELVRRQQQMAASFSVVMDGRDIGTVVLPQAECKIFLTASADIRAKRRTQELAEKGIERSFADVKAEMLERDHRDSNREHSPLRQAEDAHLVDNSNMTIDQVVQTIVDLAGAV